MAIKIGDKVRFLNSVGGGTVVRLKGKDLVMVEDEDGFEVPVLTRECVVVGEADPQTNRLKPQSGTASGNGKSFTSASKEVVAPDTEEPAYIPEETAGGDLLNISIAFLPAQDQPSHASGFETYFINESNYYLQFNYMSTPDSVWTSRYHGSIEPNTKLLVDEFALEVLNNFTKIAVQFVAYKPDKPYSMKPAYSLEQTLDTVKFYKQKTFVENDYFDEDAWIIPLVKDDMPLKQMLVNAKDLQSAMMQKVVEDKKPVLHAPEKKVKHDHIVEVDLHIHQLLDSIVGLSNTDMLNYQLDKFREVMKEYEKNKGQKIVFIHGKGNGVLRKAIEKELRTTYKEHYFQDASFKEYGFGATMVTIK
ncbi:DUF2027 domain-containing protein [Parabacteroides pacaensis]|uniref:DUF2027 domain-containing protein n=1 Tax=Parabacteroides pacaensis TaxID=2086575 RepID=UPI000D104EDF|nr:DUF2027 domain-containing protein [Parabacteroides pacaensis]